MFLRQRLRVGRLPSGAQSGTVSTKGQHCKTVLARYRFFLCCFHFSETVISYFLVLFCLFVGVLSAPNVPALPMLPSPRFIVWRALVWSTRATDAPVTPGGLWKQRWRSTQPEKFECERRALGRETKFSFGEHWQVGACPDTE